MKLDPTQPQQAGAVVTPSHTKPSSSLRPAAGSVALDSLSAASGAFTMRSAAIARPARQPSLIVAVVAGLVVGTAVTVTGRFDHVCRATLHIAAPHQTSARVDEWRRTLADYVARELGGYSELTARAQWFIEPVGESKLRLGLMAPGREVGLQQVRGLAQGFIASLAATAKPTATTPTPAEKTLSQIIERHRTAVTTAMVEAANALALVPDDPAQGRRRAFERWEKLRDEFRSKRKTSEQARAELRRLETEPDPTVGIVTNEDRRAAWGADAGLQQDLSELALRLSELKLQLLNVWQRAAGPLDRLLNDAAALRGVLESAADDPGLADGQPQPTELGDSIAAHLKLLTEFTGRWTSEFKALEPMAIDPHGGEVLEIYQRTRRRLSDYLFQADKQLAAIRDAIRDLGELQVDDARYHVFQSALLRAFHTLLAAHRRFEFAAGAMDAKNNFRLDTALTGALGLRKRARAQIRRIEDGLETAARARARSRRIHDIVESRHAVDHLRTTLDDTVEQMLDLQEELNIGADDSARFLLAGARAKLAEDRLERLRGDLVELDARLTELQAIRSVAAEAPNVELVSCEALDRPINFAARVQVAALAAALTLLAVFLGQCWVARGR